MKSSIIAMLVLAVLAILFWGSVVGGICVLCVVILALRLVYIHFKENDDFDIFDDYK